MLKIKDDVDLKELEKFGYFNNNDINYLKYLSDSEIHLDCIDIDLTTRIITRHIKDIYLEAITCKTVKDIYVQDLIQAGLVEKVNEQTRSN